MLTIKRRNKLPRFFEFLQLQGAIKKFKLDRIKIKSRQNHNFQDEIVDFEKFCHEKIGKFAKKLNNLKDSSLPSSKLLTKELFMNEKFKEAARRSRKMLSLFTGYNNSKEIKLSYAPESFSSYRLTPFSNLNDYSKKNGLLHTQVIKKSYG